MDRAKLRKKVLLDLLSGPWTVLPAVVGASSLLLAWAGDVGGGWLTLVGISGLLGSLGSLATQWIFRAEAITEQAFAELMAQEMAEQERKLDNLYKRLKKDKDPRDNECLRQLRTLYRGFQQDAEWAGKLTRQAALEITNQVEKLYEGCIMSLERSLELVLAAQNMSTPEGRDEVLQGRERLLEEVRQSIEQLAKTIDSVRALSLQRHADQDLARIRRELDESLDVARRVEQRMNTLETELGKPTVKE